jgi:periplasmic divalent cation tolerance protein
MTDKRLVFTTAQSEQEARRVANTLVDRKLAACVSIVPKMESIYTWEGKTEEAQEIMLIIKTTEAAFEKVCEAIKEMHSYEVPECLCVAVEAGNPEYLKWIDEAVRPEDKQPEEHRQTA